MNQSNVNQSNVNHYLKTKKIGFIGAGNLAQAVIKGLFEGQVVPSHQIFASNRSPGKLQKLKDQFGIQVCTSNEEVVEKSDIVILAVKPQDLLFAIEPISQSFLAGQMVLSLAAGIRMKTLSQNLPQTRLVRMIPNTPALIGRGVIGYLMNEVDPGLEAMVEDLFSCLGKVIRMEDEDKLEAFMVASSSGTGFIFELMMYWQDWIEEHGFEPKVAREIVIETFLGASLLASQSGNGSFEELQMRVASRKGVTAAGLDSMRELEIERAMRISFEKSAMRNSEMARGLK